MRLDKYLKVTRIIKRRTVANEACDAAHVTANGRPAKASYDVKVGDVLEITFGARTLRIRVLEVKDTVGKDAASSLYEVIEEPRPTPYRHKPAVPRIEFCEFLCDGGRPL